MYPFRYIVSDCDAVYDMINDPKYALTLEDAVADAVQAGTWKKAYSDEVDKIIIEPDLTCIDSF